VTIIKIHGCSGAGKTTAVRALIEGAATIDRIPVKGSGKTAAYVLDILELEQPLVILGSYDNNCGGVDTIDSATQVMEMIDHYAPHGHVIHEGLLQSTYYGAMGEHSKKYGKDYVYAFLDTPINVCLDRVVARRASNDTKRTFNPALTVAKHHTIQRLEKKLRDSGEHRVVTLEYHKPMVEQLIPLLEGK
jgi:hypothetical protein